MLLPLPLATTPAYTPVAFAGEADKHPAVYVQHIRTMPKVDVHVRDRLACVNVDELNINIQIHSSLIFTEVEANELSIDI